MTNPEFSQILYEITDHILTITFNRPSRLNAVTAVMLDEIITALDLADADDEVKAIVFTGASRAFCAGADLSNGAETFDYDHQSVEVKPSNTPKEDYPRDGGGRVTLRLFECLKPVIAAVNGAAVGAGATMQLAMDIRIASENAKFGYVFARRGIVPEGCSSWFLPRIVGVSKALEWCYSGRVFGAREARSAGLISELTSPEDLLPRAYEIAREIAENTSAVSVALTRQMIWKMLGAGHPMDAHRIDSRSVYALGKMADAREGVESFIEKRPANFTLKASTDMPSFFPWFDMPDYE